MERDQYQVMYRREDHHWWYSGMRRSALSLLRSAVNGASSLHILDAGCGTGGTTMHLREFGGMVVGLDLAWEALQPAACRGLAGRLTQATIEQLPFPDASFDVVTSFEVVYHFGVSNDARAFGEFRRILRPNGLLLLRLPAHDWLRGEHDRLVHTRHRYSRREVGKKLRAVGFAVEHLSWANSVLFAPAVAKRLLEGVVGGWRKDDRTSEPDLWQPPRLLNRFLEQCVAIEGPAIRCRLPLPFGLSVIALARAV